MLTNPKRASSQRQIALDRESVAVLRQWRQTQIAERLAWEGSYQDGDLVFMNENGTLLNPDRISRKFKRLVSAAGLPPIRFHDLRHTHATLALRVGVHPKIVSERLGHSSITITLDTYSHAIPALQEEAAQQIADLVFGA